MKALSPTLQNYPIQIVGSTKFGRYPKISEEQTWNMIVSDGWLVPYAGYKARTNLEGIQEGRGLFNSVNFNRMISVVDNNIYAIDASLFPQKIGEIETYSGNVYIAENDIKQIAICDQKNIYIYNWGTSVLTKATLDFIPNYIWFQNGYFISPAQGTNQWRLSAVNNGLSWPAVAIGNTNVGLLETKPTYVQAAVSVPGKGNLLFVMGQTVTEAWTDIGQQLFPYTRSSYFNIDYGCINPATIATNDQYVVWLGINEKSGIALMVSEGGEVSQISNDGLNFMFAELTQPQDCYGFLFKQDGHIIYQFTFFTDNKSFIYDFNTKMFFNVSDENQNYHIARRVVLFNNSYYFVSLNDGNIYEFTTKYTNLNDAICPRIRVIPKVSFPDASIFSGNQLTCTIEQGNASSVQNVDLSISKDGAESFGNPVRKVLQRQGKRQNKLRWWNLPRANDMTMQFRYYSQDRFVVGNAVLSYYQ